MNTCTFAVSPVCLAKWKAKNQEVLKNWKKAKFIEKFRSRPRQRQRKNCQKKLWNLWIFYLGRKECPNSDWDFERLKVLRQILINCILHLSPLFLFFFCVSLNHVSNDHCRRQTICFLNLFWFKTFLLAKCSNKKQTYPQT